MSLPSVCSRTKSAETVLNLCACVGATTQLAVVFFDSVAIEHTIGFWQEGERYVSNNCHLYRYGLFYSKCLSWSPSFLMRSLVKENAVNIFRIA